MIGRNQKGIWEIPREPVRRGAGGGPTERRQRRLIWEIARVATQLDRHLVSQYGVRGRWVTGVNRFCTSHRCCNGERK